jgi:hypothetical protein
MKRREIEALCDGRLQPDAETSTIEKILARPNAVSTFCDVVLDRCLEAQRADDDMNPEVDSEMGMDSAEEGPLNPDGPDDWIQRIRKEVLALREGDIPEGEYYERRSVIIDILTQLEFISSDF